MTITRAVAGTVLAAAVVAGLPSVAAAAEELTVCAAGCNHTTLAAAVAAASAGDTVRITEDLAVAGATTIGKDITVTGAPGVTVTQTGSSAATFRVTGDGATIADLEITSADVVAGGFLTVTGDDVTLDGLLVHGPEQSGPMSGWTTNRALITGGRLTGLTVTGNTWHTLRTGAYLDSGSGTLVGNTTYNTKGDYLVDAGGDYAFTANRAGDPERTSEWGIVVFATNQVPYDVQALAAANPCLTVWDQADGGEVVGPMYGHGLCDGDGDGVRDTAPPASKDECKKGGWASFNNPSFRNQGQCVSSVAKRK